MAKGRNSCGQWSWQCAFFGAGASAIGLGFGIVPESLPLSPNKNTCYWGGWGGSAVVIDQDARISAAYVMNKMADGLAGDFRSFKLLAAVYRNL